MKTLFVAASTKEYSDTTLFGIPILNIGITKISAAYKITQYINHYKPEKVINFGSCGNLKNHKLGQVLEVGTVHNNIDARPFSDYGYIPFTNQGPIKLSDSNIQLFTTDQFYDAKRTDYSQKYMEMIGKCDIVDMECYSLAYCCKQMGVSFSSYKWISDDGESDDWEQNAIIGYKNFKKIIEKKLDFN